MSSVPKTCECGKGFLWAELRGNLNQWSCEMHCNVCGSYGPTMHGPIPAAALEAAIEKWNEQRGGEG